MADTYTIEVTADELKEIAARRAQTIANLATRDDPEATQLLVDSLSRLGTLTTPLTDAATAIASTPVTASPVVPGE